MAQFREREEDENDGVPVDLKQKVCPTCRRKLQPWEAECPEDGSIPVEGVQMGSVEDQILARLNPDLLDDLDPAEPAPQTAADDPLRAGGQGAERTAADVPPGGNQENASAPDHARAPEPADDDDLAEEVVTETPPHADPPPDRHWPSETRWGAI